MTIRARDVMETHVVTVTPDTTLAELADLLISKRVSGVPVVQHGAVVGVISRSDFARVVSLDRTLAGLIAEGEVHEEFAPGETPEPIGLPPQLAASMLGRTVGQVMVAAPITVPPDAPIHEVAEVLVRNHLHRVLVVEGQTLRGVISTLDVVRLVAGGRLAER
jgi:CBS domain-containing protein